MLLAMITSVVSVYYPEWHAFFLNEILDLDLAPHERH